MKSEKGKEMEQQKEMVQEKNRQLPIFSNFESIPIGKEFNGEIKNVRVDNKLSGEITVYAEEIGNIVCEFKLPTDTTIIPPSWFISRYKAYYGDFPSNGDEVILRMGKNGFFIKTFDVDED